MRLRAFKRWMSREGIECSDALELVDSADDGGDGGGLWVRAVCDLREGDMVAAIPKQACLTTKTTGARAVLEAAGLDGHLGLAVALMYEQSLGLQSPWAPYLRLLPQTECLPLVWTPDEVDALLPGTELHKMVKEDNSLVYEDWEECIVPLLASASIKLNPKFFGVEQYFAAKSLIASRSFEIDDYHGFGMVPLADLFNHKTGAENVHFTNVSSHCESDNDVEDNSNDDLDHIRKDDESLPQNFDLIKNGLSIALVGKNSFSSPLVLEMIIVKDVKAGDEVFNTYGCLGNAALLHRYGFTEPDNPYDIVNIDLEVVLQWGSSLFSGRYIRARLSLWRRLDYSGCVSQDSEYFEISPDGEPQIELLILLYIILLPEEEYNKLDLTLSTMGNFTDATGMGILKKGCPLMGKTSEISEDLLLTAGVQDALLLLADIRETFYGSTTMEDDIEAMRSCGRRERKKFHSMMLRVSERRILKKLRAYASAGARSFRTARTRRMRKKSRS
ncbi:uncharacterized protein LOC131160674 isoform X2 [Malania oleifera]|uniref:uncharacterized protein LOC131160674 isoform X2 n=1 Tax=Malania oleifera TaxID=397392 RepID=UPI0025ADC4F1|nr:uncharacterized protein LOC131160674 isoform X2 [Malania oleifera]